MWNYWFSPNNVIPERAFERSDFPFWGSLKFWMFSETCSTFSCLNSNCWNLRPFTHQNLKNQWDKTTWKKWKQKPKENTNSQSYERVLCKNILYIYGYNTFDIRRKQRLPRTIPVTEPLSRARERCLNSWLWKMHTFPLLKITSKRPIKHFKY